MLTAFASPQGGDQCPSGGRAGTEAPMLTAFASPKEAISAVGRPGGH